jgi:hypothetical protein
MSRQILATTVILTALGEVDEDGQLAGDLCEAFLDLTETYEYVGWPRWRWCRKTSCSGQVSLLTLTLDRFAVAGMTKWPIVCQK